MRSTCEDSCTQGRDENNQTKDNQRMEIMRQAAPEWDCEHPKSRPNSFEKPQRTKNHSVLRIDVHNIVKKLMQEAFNKYDDRVIDVSE